MADKRGWSEAVAVWGHEITVEQVDGPPSLPWGRSTVRVVSDSGVTSGGQAASTAVAVHLEHRAHPGVRFTVVVDADLTMTGVEVAAMRWHAVRQGPLTTFEVDTSPGAGLALTASVLRAVNWGELHREAQRRARRAYGWAAAPAPASRWAMTVAKGQPRRPVRRGRGDAFYAALAAEYVALLHGGEPAPVKVLAEQRGETAKYVREQISRCRPRGHGMLTDPPRRGVPGGELTDKARAVLAGPGQST
ncbi:MAG: hypothetical protein ACR2LA_01790 [Acidimicrobiales bacterium]